MMCRWENGKIFWGVLRQTNSLITANNAKPGVIAQTVVTFILLVGETAKFNLILQSPRAYGQITSNQFASCLIPSCLSQLCSQISRFFQRSQRSSFSGIPTERRSDLIVHFHATRQWKLWTLWHLIVHCNICSLSIAQISQTWRTRNQEVFPCHVYCNMHDPICFNMYRIFTVC